MSGSYSPPLPEWSTDIIYLEFFCEDLDQDSFKKVGLFGVASFLISIFVAIILLFFFLETKRRAICPCQQDGKTLD